MQPLECPNWVPPVVISEATRMLAETRSAREEALIRRLLTDQRMRRVRDQRIAGERESLKRPLCSIWVASSARIGNDHRNEAEIGGMARRRLYPNFERD